MKKIIFYFILGLLILPACQDDDQNVNPDGTCLVQKMKTDFTGEILFDYDNDGTLISIAEENFNMKVKFQYDDKKRISKMEYYNFSGDSLTGYANIEWTDDQTVMSESFFFDYNGNPWLASKEKIELNDKGYPVKYSSYEKNENDEWYVDNYSEMTWDNDNLLQVDNYNLEPESGEYYLSNLVTYSYDTQKNPWYFQPAKILFNNFIDFPITKNNPVNCTETMIETGYSRTTVWEYQYNDEGFPSSYVQKIANTLTGEIIQIKEVSSIQYAGCK
jgi:hypothetical protein